MFVEAAIAKQAGTVSHLLPPIDLSFKFVEIPLHLLRIPHDSLADSDLFVRMGSPCPTPCLLAGTTSQSSKIVLGKTRWWRALAMRALLLLSLNISYVSTMILRL